MEALLTRQRTVKETVSFSGLGVHSGKKVNLTIKPAPVNHGIKFVRIDLPDHPVITAHFNNVVDTSLATVIGYDGFIVSTIEHLMASFSGLSIDNALVEIDNYEIPIMDGSAGPFTAMILNKGIQEQNAPRCYFIVKSPIGITENGKSVTIYPSDKFKITYSIDFNHPAVKQQSFDVEINETSFAQDIAPARTFGFLNEIEYLKRYGFARGGSLDNVVVLSASGVVNQDGLRFHNEFVRHKILDSIGDFSLLGMPVLGHIVISKSGHAYNHDFLQEFFKRKDSWETILADDIANPAQYQQASAM